jgi:hypothetical protein
VGALIECGLVNIGSEGHTAIWTGGHPGGEVWRLTLMQLREPMIGTGLMSADDLDAVIELCGDPRLRFMSQITMAAWGQRRS